MSKELIKYLWMGLGLIGVIVGGIFISGLIQDARNKKSLKKETKTVSDVPTQTQQGIVQRMRY